MNTTTQSPTNTLITYWGKGMNLLAYAVICEQDGKMLNMIVAATKSSHGSRIKGMCRIEGENHPHTEIGHGSAEYRRIRRAISEVTA